MIHISGSGEFSKSWLFKPHCLTREQCITVADIMQSNTKIGLVEISWELQDNTEVDSPCVPMLLQPLKPNCEPVTFWISDHRLEDGAPRGIVSFQDCLRVLKNSLTPLVFLPFV